VTSSDDNSTLNGRWALVTGAAKRIGAVIARTLHGAGANVAIHYNRSAADADELAAELNRLRAKSTFTVAANMLDIDSVEQMAKQVLERTAGKLDILVNNASTFYPTPIGTITPEQWHDLMSSNLKAPLFLSQAVLPALRDARGVIINIVDVHSQRPLRDHPVYGAAKAGLAMLTRSLAKDLGPHVRVNGVSPGAILADDGIDALRAAIIKQTALKRSGEPEDIARTVLFLVRDAPYITGQIIAVDGGRSVGW
jgi:pteridine reductase